MTEDKVGCYTAVFQRWGGGESSQEQAIRGCIVGKLKIIIESTKSLASFCYCHLIINSKQFYHFYQG